MTTLHPAFDLKTRTWFLTEPKAEAATLSALIKLLPAGAKFEGYWPQGFQATRPKDTTQRRVYLPTKSSFHIQPSTRKAPTQPKLKPPKPESTRHAYNAPDINLVLDDWVLGLTGEAIAEKYNIPETRQVARIIVKARKAGDPRAAPHNKKNQPRNKKHNYDAVLDLWAAGLTGPEIGVRLGLPRPTTAGGIVAMCRKAGDPRAVARAPTSWHKG